MAAPSLQDGIDRAGSPVRLLWKVNPAPWNPDVVKPEYAGWRQEQAAWHELGFATIRATVVPVPYDSFARTRYREATGGGPLTSAQRSDV